MCHFGSVLLPFEPPNLFPFSNPLNPFISLLLFLPNPPYLFLLLLPTKPSPPPPPSATTTLTKSRYVW